MSFRETGKVLKIEQKEALQYCDWCGAQISIDAYRSKPHWEVQLDRGRLSADDTEREYDLCSLACLSAWAADANDDKSKGEIRQLKRLEGAKHW